MMADDVPVKMKVMAGNEPITSKEDIVKGDLDLEFLGSMMALLT